MDFDRAPYGMLFCEFMGVFMIVFTTNLTANNGNNPYNPFVVPFTIMTMIFIMGHISKAMFNAIIVLIDFLKILDQGLKYNPLKAIAFTAAQIAGAYLAMMISLLCLPELAVGPVVTGIAEWKAAILEGYRAFPTAFATLFLCGWTSDSSFRDRQSSKVNKQSCGVNVLKS